MVFFPISKHVFVKFLDNYNVLRAADGTNRYLIEARIDQYTTVKFLDNYNVIRAADGTNRFLIEACIDQYTTLSNNMRLCISNDSLSF